MKTLLLIVRRSLAQHALSTTITALSVALSCGLLMSVIVLKTQTYQAMTAGATRFDAVIGARGSALQLVLNAVFHLDSSPGNIPYVLYTRIAQDSRVSLAIPYAVGDNYRGFRLVATIPAMFTFKTQGKNFELDGQGSWFDPLKPEAVVGSFVAQHTHLKVGDVFNAYHGLVFDESKKHDEAYRVVGVLKPTNTPADRAIWIPLDAFYRLEGHELREGGDVYHAHEGQDIPDSVKELSAIMVKFKNPTVGVVFDKKINRQEKEFTMAWPIAKIVSDFLHRMGWFHQVLTVMAGLIAVVSSVNILTGIYNSMNERRRELAILRALGARRRLIVSAIILESAAIAGCGVLVGFVVYAIIMAVAKSIIRAGTGVVIEPWQFHYIFIQGPLLILSLGALAGIIPAFKAYRSPVADDLVLHS